MPGSKTSQSLMGVLKNIQAAFTQSSEDEGAMVSTVIDTMEKSDAAIMQRLSLAMDEHAQRRYKISCMVAEMESRIGKLPQVASREDLPTILNKKERPSV